MSDPAYVEHVRVLNPLGRVPTIDDFEFSKVIRDDVLGEDPYNNAVQGACSDGKGNLFAFHAWKPKNVKIHRDVTQAPSVSDYETSDYWKDDDRGSQQFVFEMPALIMYDKKNRDAIASAELGDVFFGHQQLVCGVHEGREYWYTSYQTFENYYRFHTRMPHGDDPGGKHWNSDINGIEPQFDTWSKAVALWQYFGSGIELHEDFVTDADNAYIMRFEIERKGTKLTMKNPGKVQWIGDSLVPSEITYDRFDADDVDMSDSNNTVGHNKDRSELCMEIDYEATIGGLNYKCMKFGSVKVERTLGGTFVDARQYVTHVVDSKMRIGSTGDPDGFQDNTFIQGLAIVDNMYLCVYGQARKSVSNRRNTWAYYDRTNGQTVSLRNCLGGTERPYDMYEAEGIHWHNGVINFMIKMDDAVSGAKEPYYIRNARYYMNSQYRCY